MNIEVLEEGRRLLTGATAGPWVVALSATNIARKESTGTLRDPAPHSVLTSDRYQYEQRCINAQLIVWLRNNAAELVADAIERDCYKAENERLREYLNQAVARIEAAGCIVPDDLRAILGGLETVEASDD